MSLVKFGLAIPSLVACVLAASPQADVHAKKKRPSPAQEIQRVAAGDRIVERRLRIEGILSHLERVAAIAMQMKPEEADRLEPVIVDLTERTLELVEVEALNDSASDRELDGIEEALDRLIVAVSLQAHTETFL